MMSNLEIKKVEFMGDELVAVRENDSGKIYVAINWVCDGLGVQARRQKERLQKHKTFSRGVSTLAVPSKGGTQDTVVIELDFLPLWLASINPDLVGENIIEKLVNYQLKAKDVLADAFLAKLDSQANTDIIPQIPRNVTELVTAYIEKSNENEQLKPKAEAYDKFIEATNAQTWLQISKVLGIGRTKLCRLLRQHGIIMDNLLPYQQYMTREYFVTKELTAYNGETAFNYTQTLVTAKGLDFIRKLLKEQQNLQVAN